MDTADDDVTVDAVLAAYPRAGIDHDNLELYRGLLQRRLMLNRCDECSAWHHPPRAVCPACWSTAVRATESVGTGTVFMHTTVAGRRGGPHRDIVTVELDEQSGLRFTSPSVRSLEGDIVIGRRAMLTWTDGDAPTPAFMVTP